jgi:hypothetical protein
MWKNCEQQIQNEHIRNIPILLNWNDIRNADMSELGDIVEVNAHED